MPKPLPDYKKSYLVLNDGSIINLKTKCQLHPMISSTGYLVLDLYIAGKRYRVQHHRLVADAHLPKVNGKEYINHKDFNPKNNHASNLEWCTISENNKYSKNHGRGFDLKNNPQKGENNSQALLEEKDIQYIRFLFTQGKRVVDIWRKNYNHFSYVTIHSIVSGRRWSHVKNRPN